MQIEREELKTHQSLSFAPENIARRVLERLARALLDDPSQARAFIHTNIATQWQKERELSQVQVLDILVAHLKHEELELYFDYNHLAIECSELLDLVDSNFSGRVQEEGSRFQDLSLPNALKVVQGVLFETCYVAATRTEHAGGTGNQAMLQQLAEFFVAYRAQHGGKRMEGAQRMLDILMLRPLVGVEVEEARHVNRYAATVEDAEDDGS